MKKQILAGHPAMTLLRPGSMRSKTLSVFALACAWALTAQAADYYLDRNATGAGNGTSWSNAWRAVSNVVWSNVRSADTLWIQGGNYGEHLEVAFRTNITVRIATNAVQKAVFLGGQLYNADNCLIDGWLQQTQYIQITRTCSAGQHGFWIRETSNTTVRGIEVNRLLEYASDTKQHHGIEVNGVNNDRVVLDSCYIHHTTGDGVSLNATTYGRPDAYDSFVVTNCVITDVGDDGIQAAVNQATVANCYIDNNGFPTYFGGHPDGFQLNPDGFNVKLFNNVIRGFNQNIFIEYARSNVFLYNNILIGFRTNGTDRGINHSAREPFGGTFLVANNVMYNFTTYCGWNGGFMTNAALAQIHNNIFVNCRQLAATYAVPFLDDSNIYWDMPGTQFYDTSGVPSAPPANRNTGSSLNIDPVFASLVSFDLQSISPAIGTARNLDAYFTTDRNGALRGLLWDPGVSESTVTLPPAPAPSPPTGLRVVP